MPTSAPAPDLEYEDPYEAHFRRAPLSTAEVQILVLDASTEDPSRAQVVADGLLGLLAGRNRRGSVRVVPVDRQTGWGPALESAIRTVSAPLVLVTTAAQPWTDAHLTPMLKAIDAADHVLGLRSRTRPGRLARWLGRLPWRLLFHIPLTDLHSPCRIHRREAIAAIPLQSRSAFAHVELLAKATFLGHLVDEVAVPGLPATSSRSAIADLRDVFRKPVFVRPAPSTPAEEAQGEEEGDDRPGREDHQRTTHIE